MRKSLGAILALAFAALVAVWGPAHAQSRAPLAQEVKAAYLFKFLGFVEWPSSAFADPGAAIVIGVMGSEDVFSNLEQIVAGRTAQGRPVQVKRVRPGESLSGLHVLYAGGLAVKVSPSQPLLVVTDGEDALNQGGAINFVMLDGRVRFEVATEPAARRGLRLSSQLLAVASQVRTGKP